MSNQTDTPDAKTEKVNYYRAHNGKTHLAYRDLYGVTTSCGLGNNKPKFRPQAITGQCEASEITCGRCKRYCA